MHTSAVLQRAGSRIAVSLGSRRNRRVFCSAEMTGSKAQRGQRRRVVLWFRNDLRLHDNVIIHEAVQAVDTGMADDIVPVFCFDSRWFHETAFGNGQLKTGAYRAQYLLESVQNLKKNLRSVGSDLVVRMGRPEDELPKLCPQNGAMIVYAQREVTSEETRAEIAVTRALKKCGSRMELFWGSTLYHLDDLPFDLHKMPTVFTPFRNKVENGADVRRCFPSPQKGQLPFPSDFIDVDSIPKSIEDLNEIVPKGDPLLKTPSKDDRAAFDMKGGENVALQRLHYYLWDSKLIEKYFEIRNGMVGGDYSTKLAPALAHGCISPRHIYWQIQQYEMERIANKSTYWVVFELIWRDYFKYYALAQGDEIFKIHGPNGKSRPWKVDKAMFERWRDGQTGWPLIDANMRELKQTGFMSNRGRQNVASFLCLDLGLDWRLGADWFESMLIDYDPASNWGNWVAAAGLTGGRINKFNITKQSKDYDPDGEYIRLWCPELKNIPSSKIHEPSNMSRKDQDVFQIQIGQDYPQAIPSSYFSQSPGGGQKKYPSRFGNKNGKGPRRPKASDYEY